MPPMRKSHFLLILGAIALLAIGFGAGNLSPKLIQPIKKSWRHSEDYISALGKSQTLPNSGAVTKTTAAQSAQDTIDIHHEWPEWQQAQAYWNSIHAKRSGVNLSNAGNQAKAALDQMVAAADSLAAKGDSYNAVQKLHQALELGADNAAVWLKFADLSARAGDQTNALYGYLIAEARDPNKEDSAKLYHALADIYGQRGDGAVPLTILALQKSIDVKSDPVLSQRLETLRGQRLELLNVEARQDSDTPEACLTFSWPLRDDGSVAYEDFISVEPAVKLAAIATDKQLCLRGFSYGQDYQLILKSGLPAAGTSKLPADNQRSVSFGDRAARLSFQANTYILPRLNNVGVPLHSVNVDVARVEILQINDRNLVSQIISGTALREEAYSYNINQLRNDHGRSLWSGFINLKRADNQSTTTAVPFASVIKDSKPGLYAVVAQVATKKTAHTDSNDNNADVVANKKEALDSEYEVSSSNENMAIQWLVVTDVGLTTYQGQDGVHVIARSFESGKPLSNIKLRLLSRDNTILSDSVTDTEGHAKFNDALLHGDGGKDAKLIQAFSNAAKNSIGDFTFLDLQQPALDLSDRGVDGRESAQKLDVFLYSDRGIYRPGEDLHLSALLRDNNANALANAPKLTLKIFRPDGVLANQQLITANNAKLGGYHTTYNVPDNARMGIWRADIFADPTEPKIGSYSWQVEDFVPARLDVKIAVPDNAMLKTSETLHVFVQADYLYGAPAADAKGDASLDLRLADSTLFKDFADYHFGLMDAKFTAQQIALTMPKTDDKGASGIDVKLDTVPATSHPLEALLHASVFDDSGRGVNRTAVVPVTRAEPYLGLKTLHSEKSAHTADTDDEDWNFSTDRTFALVAVDRAGKRVTQSGLRYRLVEEDYYYDWYTARSERNYQRQIHDIPVKTGEVNITADKPAEIAFSNLKYGTYRLEVFNPAETTDRLTAVSDRFNVGWTERSPTAKDKPDSLQLHLDHAQYKPGDKAQLFIKAPFAGQAELVIARETVLEQRIINLPAAGATVTVPVSTEWGAGVYALVHAYRPGQKIVAGAKNQIVPGRAVGVIWLGMDPKPRTLDIKMTVPEKITPRQKLNVPVEVKNANGKAEITLAAVDEGILQLTDFNSPDPAKYLYAKRKLGVDIRDAYGRLLDPTVDAVGQVRSGGDQAGRAAAGLPSKWIKSVSLFSGPVALDDKGRATIPLEIPEFNGKLRLMAVAYNTNQVGHVDQKMIVRDPVVVNLGLPRFLAPNDNAEITLNLDNVDGAAGKAHVEFTTTGGLKLGDYTQDITLAAKQKQQIKFNLKADTIGAASLHMALTLPDGQGGQIARQQDWPLTVRPIQTYQTTVKSGVLKADEKLTLDKSLLDKVLPEDAVLTFAISTVPDLQLARVIKQLDRYPYGCLEQTSSRLLPLLYLRDVIDQAGLKDKKALPTDDRINKAIEHILSMQKGDGSFSLWNGYGPTEDFLSLYAIDVLQRAQTQGYKVPDYVLHRAYAWLQNEVKTGDFATPILHRRAYAYYLLARAGLVEPGQVRYFAERYGHEFDGRLANGFTAAALSQIGDSARAAPFWTKALTDTTEQQETDYHDYGSTVRDQLIILTLAAEARQSQDNVIKFADKISGDIARSRYFTTQENGWVILASHALYQNQGDLQVALNDAMTPSVKNKPILQSWQGPDWSALDKEQVVQNKGQHDLHYTIAVNAIPKDIQPPVANGFKIDRQFYTRAGKKVDLTKVASNQMLIAVIDGEVNNSMVKDQSLLVDLLPAGLELESAKFGNGQNVEDFGWIGALTTPAYQELRDDRFVAAFDPAALSSQNNQYTDDDGNAKPLNKPLDGNHFRFAYAVRAVTKGQYQLPATQVEAMYQPQFQARTAPAAINIKE